MKAWAIFWAWAALFALGDLMISKAPLTEELALKE